MLEGGFAPGGVLYRDDEQAAPVMGLLGSDCDGPRPAIFNERAQGLLSVLFGQDAHARKVLRAGQFVQAGTDRGGRPPRT